MKIPNLDISFSSASVGIDVFSCGLPLERKRGAGYLAVQRIYEHANTRTKREKLSPWNGLVLEKLAFHQQQDITP